MTDLAPIRHTVDTLNSDALDALYASLENAEAALDRVWKLLGTGPIGCCGHLVRAALGGAASASSPGHKPTLKRGRTPMPPPPPPAPAPKRPCGSKGQPASTAPLAAGLPLVRGTCPACGRASLFLGSGGHVTCSIIDCPNPSAADEQLHGEQPTKATTEVTDRVRALHCRNGNTDECEYCSARDYPDYAVPYPCDTVRALDGQEQ